MNRNSASGPARWLPGLLMVSLAVVSLAFLAVAIFAFWMWSYGRASAIALKDEVARLQAAGYPMTPDDLYRVHQTPVDIADTTPAWAAAISSFDSKRMYNDAKGLPYVDDGDPALLRPNSSDSKLLAAEQFLAAYDSTLQAVLAAANQPGECRFPVKFEQGISAVTLHVHDIRQIVRLLALSVHVQAVRGEADKTLDSLAAMFTASAALSHQHTIVEHLVRLATLGSALSQTQLALNELELTDAQLSRLQQELAGIELQSGFTRSLIGERALSYQSLQETGAIMLSDDCKSYLQVMTSIIDFSKQPPFVGRQRLQTLVDSYKGLAPAGANTFIALALPSLTASFDAYATAAAYRDALQVALAAERHRLETGRFPSQLTDLTPNYLASVSHDPFDGQPLRFRAEGDDILIYSIGRDGKDDGGQNSPGKSSEPDIVVRLSAFKARTQ